ncbi:MAG: hypothetical protein U5K84_06285 [Alkalibacterium sp.]|nr:hypothetical protein [Alkalibacterium sp.]
MAERSEYDMHKVTTELKSDVPVIMLTETLTEGIEAGEKTGSNKVTYHPQSSGSDKLIELISETISSKGDSGS